MISAYVPHSHLIKVACVALFGIVGEYDRVDIGDLVQSRDGSKISGTVRSISETHITFMDKNDESHSYVFANVKLLDWVGMSKILL